MAPQNNLTQCFIMASHFIYLTAHQMDVIRGNFVCEGIMNSLAVVPGGQRLMTAPSLMGPGLGFNVMLQGVKYVP